MKITLKARKELAALEVLLENWVMISNHGSSQSELENEQSKSSMHLQTAEAVSRRREQELVELDVEHSKQKQMIDSQETELLNVSDTIRESESTAPDISKSEKDLLQLREEENQARDELGAARQKVDILVSLRSRNREYAIRKETQLKRIAKLKNLERAFGRDGVPALLIEQAPQIESRRMNSWDCLSRSNECQVPDPNWVQGQKRG
jgi:exonuclease SbcC